MLFITLAALFGLTLTLSVGANDLANIMSTTLGSKAATMRQAIIIAIIFETAGAVLGGSHVTNTLRNGIINTQLLINTPEILLYGMLSVLLGGTVWMMVASYFGLPVSVTNTIVGAIVGFGAVVVGVHAIHWQKVGYILISWVTSPTIAGIVAYLLFMSIQRLILGRSAPFFYAKRYAPIYLFIVGVVLADMVVIKGLRHFNIDINHWHYFIIVLATGLVVMQIGTLYIQRIKLAPGARLRAQFASTEKVFAILMALTACAMVFAHGSNDVAIAVGPMVAVVSIIQNHSSTLDSAIIPEWTVLLGVSGVLVGLIAYGRKVIATVGSGITQLTPSRAFSATLSAASIVVVSTSLGIPLSTTQTLVGAILGVGLARGIGALDLRIVRNIFMSWLITIPVGATFTIIFFYMFKGLVNI